MNELEQEFITQSATDLNNISKQLQENKTAILSEKFLNDTFRTLHTIKGTAQTFGFSDAGNLAHSLENMVSAAKHQTLFIDNFNSFLREGIELLVKSFERKKIQIPKSFADTIKLFENNSEQNDSDKNLPEEIPETITGQLSAQEKSALYSALKNDKTLSVLEVGFNLSNFVAEFKDFRANLGKKGEIIAALPCSKFSAVNKIGFQMIFVAQEDIKTFAENNSLEITFSFPEILSYSLQGILAKIIAHGKDTAKTLGKDVEFIVLADDFEPPAKVLKLIFDVLLHLVRNAVSHAIAKKGRIEIDIKTEEKAIVLSVSDNGKGLNLEKIKAIAVEKNLKPDIGKMSEQEILELIFLPEFSTAEVLTKFSGRGIGLDVVKNLTENVGGKLHVRTEKDKGTIFQVFLPK
jgi:two-component system, chemotaxis family, sensor kinase CheA